MGILLSRAWDGRSTPSHACSGPPGRTEAAVVRSRGARLLLYFDGLIERRGRLVLPLADTAPFEEDIPAELGELAGVRARLRAWLDDHHVNQHDRFAIVLACSEAIGNAIEHGYRDGPPGRVRVSAALVDERVDVVVADSGRWQRQDLSEDRGRGLMLMRRLMDDVTVDRGGGTAVSMSRRVSRAER